MGERERAREVYELGVDLLEQRPASRYLIRAYKQLASLLREQDDSEGALEILERALGVQDSVGRALS